MLKPGQFYSQTKCEFMVNNFKIKKNKKLHISALQCPFWNLRKIN